MLRVCRLSLSCELKSRKEKEEKAGGGQAAVTLDIHDICSSAHMSRPALDTR